MVRTTAWARYRRTRPLVCDDYPACSGDAENVATTIGRIGTTRTPLVPINLPDRFPDSVIPFVQPRCFTNFRTSRSNPMPTPFESLLNDSSSIGHSARLAGRIIGISAITLTLISSVTGDGPQSVPPNVQRNNPFVSSPARVTNNPFGSTPRPAIQPVAQAHLQVPRAKMASASAKSVFVGPQWDSGATKTRVPDAEAYSNVAPDFAPASPAHASVDPLAQTTPAFAESQPTASSRPTRLPDTLPDPRNSLSGRPAYQTKLASASRKRADFLSNQTPSNHSTASVYLATQTARSQFEIAAGLLQQAQLEYECSAFASAETSVWQSLERSAQAIDLTNTTARTSEEVSALKRLHRGRRALIEACDFVGPFAQQDPTAIARLARAHETPVLRETLPPMRRAFDPSSASTVGLPAGSEAIDRYLDYARMQFSILSAKSLLAAQTLDLLAAIRLGRNELSQLPGPTAICLRRAAVQGQSANADLVAKLGHHLADVGLIDEARWALRHSLSLQPNQANAARLAAMDAAARQPGRANRSSDHLGRSVLAATRSRARTPDVITMSPEQFASISQSVMPGRPAVRPDVEPTSNASQSVTAASLVSSRANTEPSPEEKRSFLKAFTASFRTDQAGATVLPPGANEPQRTARKSSRSFPAVKKWW